MVQKGMSGAERCEWCKRVCVVQKGVSILRFS